jgi:hypothetical protein
MDCRTQFLLTTAEIIAAGGSSGEIQQVGFNVAVCNTYPMNNFNIRMQNTTLTSMTDWVTSGWTTCYTGTYSVPGTGWQMILLQTPFDWNGSNLLVEICYDNTSYSGSSTVYGSTAGNMCKYQATDLPTGSGCDLTSGSIQTIRPNFRFVEQHNVLTLKGTVADTKCYSATQTIIVAGGSSTFTVVSGGSVTMIAGHNIVLLPTTAAHSGGYMHAYISTSFCGTLPPAMVATPVGTEAINLPIIQERSFFKVYPNPTTGNFTLEISDNVPESTTVEIEIYGMRGERLLNEQFSGEKKHEFSLNGKPSGIYFIRVQCREVSGSVKIIKR